MSGEWGLDEWGFIWGTFSSEATVGVPPEVESPSGAYWGLSLWGLSFWGAGGAESISTVVQALAVTEHSVLVYLPSVPLQQSEIGVGDALNPNTWTVTNAGQTLTPMAVIRRHERLFEIVTFEAQQNWQQSITVGSSTLIDLTSGVLPTFSVSVPGVRRPAPSTGPSALLVDVANPQFLDGQPNARMRVTDAGDYAVETGAELVRKLVIRMLTTLPGEFFAATSFGVGIQLAEPMTGPGLTELRVALERNLKTLPNVTSVSSKLEMGPSTLKISVRVQMPAESITDTLTIPIGSGTLF